MSAMGSHQIPLPPTLWFPVTVELPLSQVGLSKLLQWQPGDPITADQPLKPTAVMLRVNGSNLGKGSICQLEQHWAIRISQLGA